MKYLEEKYIIFVYIHIVCVILASSNSYKHIYLLVCHEHFHPHNSYSKIWYKELFSIEMVRACALSSRRGRQLSVHPYISMVGNTEVSTLWSKGCFLHVTGKLPLYRQLNFRDELLVHYFLQLSCYRYVSLSGKFLVSAVISWSATLCCISKSLAMVNAANWLIYRLPIKHWAAGLNLSQF